MKAKKAITAGLLVICGALVFFIISGNEATGAYYNNSATELASASDAEELVAELEYVVEILEGAEMESNKQIDLTPILFTFNICWLIDKAKQFLEESEEKSDLYERFREIVYELLQIMEDLNSLKAKDNFASSEGGMLVDLDFPSWYYYFAGEGSDSYIEVTYSNDNQEGLVFGSIEFVGGKFDVLWNVKLGKTQRLYFSCYFDVKAKWTPIPIPMPIIDSNLLLLRSYWNDIEGEFNEAVNSFNLYRFCESWYCDSDDDFCILKCRLNLGLPSLVDEVGEDFGDNWSCSPLLTLVPFRKEWTRNQDHFDIITLAVDDALGREVKFDSIKIVLNNEPIVDISEQRAMLPGQPLPLYWDIYFGRRNRVGLDDIADVPPSLEDLLDAATRDLGQAWRFGCPPYEEKGFDQCGYKVGI